MVCFYFQDPTVGVVHNLILLGEIIMQSLYLNINYRNDLSDWLTGLGKPQLRLHLALP